MHVAFGVCFDALMENALNSYLLGAIVIHCVDYGMYGIGRTDGRSDGRTVGRHDGCTVSDRQIIAQKPNVVNNSENYNVV